MFPLLLAELRPDGSLSASTARLARALSSLGALTVLVAGDGCQAAAETMARWDGVSEVLVVDSPILAGQPAELVAQTAQLLAHQYSPIAAPATPFGRGVIPRLAALLDVTMAGDVVTLVDGETFERPLHAGTILATVRLLDKPALITIRPAGFTPVAPGATPAPVRPIDPPEDHGLYQRVGITAPPGERPDLTTARLVVAGGAGTGSCAGFTTITTFANTIGAAIGATRSAVDAEFAPNDCQIGQTGKIIAPEFYFAAGISGAIQHLAGVKDARCIVAINNDPNAPIMAAADFSLVADLAEALPRLQVLLNNEAIATTNSLSTTLSPASEPNA